MTNREIVSFLILMLLQQFAGTGLAQTGTIKGFITSAETNEKLIFCNVVLEGTNLGMTTDENGFFQFTKLSYGKYKVLCSYVGYHNEDLEIIVSMQPVVVKIQMIPNPQAIDEAVISGAKALVRRKPMVSVKTISKMEIEEIPSLGLKPDLSQYLVTNPGFMQSGEQGGQIYSRGGSQVQNKFILDGIPLYHPFHSSGLYSVIDTDIISVANIYNGGFPADQGGRISSIVDIHSRDGNNSRFEFKASVSPMNSSLVLEGPLVRNSHGLTSSFLLSGKASMSVFQKSKNDQHISTFSSPYQHKDLFGKINIGNRSGSEVQIIFFDFSDVTKFLESSNFSWGNRGIGINTTLVPVGANGLIKTSVNGSNYRISWEEQDEDLRYNDIKSSDISLSFLNYWKNSDLEIGLEFNTLSTDFDYHNQFSFSISEKVNASTFSGFTKWLWKKDRFILCPGLRMSYYSTNGKIFLEPRLSAKFLVSERLRLKSAIGHFSQNLVSAIPDTDVRNLFHGYMVDPYRITSTNLSHHTNHNLQVADHFIFGIEFDLLPALSIELESYLKNYTQVISLNPYKRFPIDSHHSSLSDILTMDYISETGYSAGLDCILSYSQNNLSSKVSYSLGKSMRFNGIEYYSPFYDRRHNLVITNSLSINKDKTLLLQTSFYYGSGMPFTPVAGFYEKVDFSDFNETPVLHSKGIAGVLFGNTNSERLPDYHRLDLSVKKTFSIQQHSRIDIACSIYNCYNRKNVFYFDQYSLEVSRQLPFIINFGITYNH